MRELAVSLSIDRFTVSGQKPGRAQDSEGIAVEQDQRE